MSEPHKPERQNHDNHHRFPIERRQPAFSEGTPWRVWMRKIMAERLICTWRKGLISDQTVWRFMKHYAPKDDE